MQAVYGYRIYTETTENSNAIGLYSGQIRWLESELAGLAEPWKTILVSGVSAATDDGLDTRLGGGVAEVGGFDLVVDNTSQIAQRLDTLGIVLTGKRCEKIRIDPSNLREYVEFTGYCEDVKWNEREMMIPVQDCRLKRDAVLATMVTADNRPNASSEIIGSVIPVTYGEIDKAKMVRTANKKITFENPAYGHYQNVSTAFGFAYTIIGTPTYPYGLTVFPVIGKGTSPTREYKIQLAGADVSVQWTRNGAPVTTGTVWLTNLNGQYLYVVSGDGNGQYRRIEVAWCDLNAPTYIKPITIIVSDCFETEPIGNTTGDEKHNADGDTGSNSWVQIVDIKREYESDVVTLKDFLDDSGTVIASPVPLDLFSFDQPQNVNVDALNTAVSVSSKPRGFYPLPEYAYTEKTSALKNSITIDAKLFKSNPDQMDSFTIIPVKSCGFFTDATLLKLFNPDDGVHWNAAMKVPTAAGVYHQIWSVVPPTMTQTVTGTFAETIDRDDTTYHRTDTRKFPTGNFYYLNVRKFLLPAITDIMEWDGCYFLIDAKWELGGESGTNPSFYLKYRRFLGNAINVVAGTANPLSIAGAPTVFIKNAPDFYYDKTLDRNQSFYWNSSVGYHKYSGYSRFELADIDSVDKYNAIVECYFATRAYPASLVGIIDILTLNELAVMFRKSVSIQDAIYTGIRGRIRGTAWRAGRPATDLLDDPIDIAEDLLRRQNWSETGDTETPGIEQAPHARINTKTTHGGFEATSLDTPRGMVAARQVLEYDASRTSELLHSLCREFFLIQYRESNGSECITYFPERDTEPSIRRITLSDVPAGVDIPDVQAPSPSDVFCYDINLRHKRNYASGSFDGLLSITHTDAATYNPAYVTGYDGGYKQAIWERAHQLYVKYRRQEKPPAELVELEWHRTVDGAAWYIRNLLNWSDKQRLVLPVLDDVARKIPKFSRITLNLPHHTDGSDVVCFVERVKRNPKSGVSELSLVFYDDVDWTSGGVSLSDSSASDSASSSSDVSASDSLSSFSGLSKSSSSSSGSESSESSGSSDSVSSSSGVLVTDDHRHTKIVNPDTSLPGLEVIAGNEIQVEAFLKQLNAGTGQGTNARFVVLNGNYAKYRMGIANGPQARWMLDAQAHDLDLTAISALTGTGIACRTAANTWATRNLVSGNTGIVVTNPARVAANPTITLNASLINGSIVDSLHHHSVLYRSSDGAAALTVNAAGNVGISAAASAWHADDIGIDIGAYAGISSFNNAGVIPPCIRLSTNIYRNAVGNWIVKTNGRSSLFYAEEDAFFFQVDGPIAKLAGASATLTTMLKIGTGGVTVNNLADAAVGYVKSSNAGLLSRQTGVPWADVTNPKPYQLWESDGDAAAVTVNAAGLVGFGIAPGVARVDVKGNASHYNLYLEENSGTEAWQIGVDAAGALKFYNSGVLVHEMVDDSADFITYGLAQNTLHEQQCFSSTPGHYAGIVTNRSLANTIANTQTTDGTILMNYEGTGVDSGGNGDFGYRWRVTQVGASGAKVPCKMEWWTSSSSATVLALTVDEGQKLWIGSTADTNLYRSGANVLKTDDAFQSAELACGCAPAGYGVDSESALLTGHTYGKFGVNYPVYLIADSPHVGFNAYYYGGYKFGKGSTTGTDYAGVIKFDQTTGAYTILSTAATGNADAAATMSTRFTLDISGVLTVAGMNLGDTTLTKYKEGTFTCRLTDGSNNTVATGTAKYVIVGKKVTLTLPALVGNIPDEMYLKDIPTEIAPASDVDCPIWVRNNNANVAGSLHARYGTEWWAGIGYPAGDCAGNTAGIPGPQSVSYAL